MAFLGTRKLDDAPILIATYGGYISAHDLDDAGQAGIPIYEQLHEDAVLIIDVTQGESSFAEIFRILQHGIPAQNLTDFPYRVDVMVVGTDAMAKLYVDAARLKQFGGQQMPMFATLDSAISAARQRIAARKTEKAS